MIGVRLQGGPFDGSTFRLSKPVPRLYVRQSRTGKLAVWFEQQTGTEVYRRDEERDGWLIYLYTDEDLDRHILLTHSVLALDGSGA